MLIAIPGKMGSGKTLTMTALGYRAYLKGERIYSNYPLSFPHTTVGSIDELMSIRRGTFLGDELWSWMDSRSGGSKKNKFISALLLKSRKRGFDVYYTLQHMMQIDARVRRVTDVIVIPKLNHPTKATRCRLEFIDIFGDRIRAPISFNVRPVFRLYDTAAEVRDISGFEAEKLKRKMKEKKILERAEKEGITLDENDF